MVDPPLLSFIYKDVSKAGSHSGSSSSSTSFGAFWLEPPVNVSYSRVIDSYSRVIGKSTKSEVRDFVLYRRQPLTAFTRELTTSVVIGNYR